MTWAAVPILRLFETGAFTLPHDIIFMPTTAPIMPTITTIADVRAGMPPICLEISIAIGVDTDFGARERIISSLAPSHLATNTTDTMPTMHPVSSAMKSGKNWFLMCFNSL